MHALPVRMWSEFAILKGTLALTNPVPVSSLVHIFPIAVLYSQYCYWQIPAKCSYIIP